MKEMIILSSALISAALVMNGCGLKNIFVETKKASYKYTTVGYVNTNAPIVKSPEDEKKEEKIQEYEQRVSSYNNFDNVPPQEPYEMVGYIVNIEKEPGFSDLYVYTFTDALRSQKIKFYSKSLHKYPSDMLVRIYVKDNFLKSIEPYRVVTKRRRLNRAIGVPLESYLGGR